MVGLFVIVATVLATAHRNAPWLPVTAVVSLRQGKCGSKTTSFVSKALAALSQRAHDMRLCTCMPSTLSQLQADYRRPLTPRNLAMITLAERAHFDVPLGPSDRFESSTQHVAVGVRWSNHDPTQLTSFLYLDLLDRSLRTTRYIGWGMRGDPLHLSQSACPVR